MNVDVIRTKFAYHYGRFREIWESIETLTDAQFVQEIPYSLGSVRNHMVHVIDDDKSWIAFLEQKERPTLLKPEDFPTRATVRAIYDKTESYTLNFVQNLDEMLLNKTYHWHPPVVPTPQRIIGWQVLHHMVNHGTDHRAQILRALHDLGAPTFDQDLMAYLWQSGKTLNQ